MNGKQTKAGKDRCQEPSTFVSGGSTTKAQTVGAIQAALKKYMQTKYSISSRIHFLRPIDSIVTASRDQLYVEHKFLQDYDDNSEYMRRYYKRRETSAKINQLCEYFKYHYEIPRIFLEGYIQIIDSFHDRRRHKIYQQVKCMIGKENIVGDESAEDHNDGEPKRFYSAILKGVKFGPIPITKAVTQPTASDTLQRIVGQLESARGDRSYADLSITVTDHFKEKQQNFVHFLNGTQPDFMKKISAVLKRHGSSDYKATMTSTDTPQLMQMNEMQLKKQNKPTVVKVNPLLTKDIKGIKSIIGKALIEPKRSPRENMISSSRVAKLSNAIKQRGKNEYRESTSIHKKSIATINNFRKDIEEFHLANSLSTRNKAVFKSLLDKNPNGEPSAKSISPKLNLMTSTRMGMDSMKILKTEASPKLRAKFLMDFTKDIKSKVRSSQTQQLVTVKSTGNLNEESADRLGISRPKHGSRDRQRSGSNNWSSTNRASIGNISTSPRDFILIKRLKTEENSDKLLERKQSSYTKFNVINKKMSLGGQSSITSTAMDLKKGLTKHLSNSKANLKPATSKAFNSFRSRSKIGSMNIN